MEQALLLGVWRNISGCWLANVSISGSFRVAWNSRERRVQTTEAAPLLSDWEGRPQLSAEWGLEFGFLCVGIPWGACWKFRFLGHAEEPMSWVFLGGWDLGVYIKNKKTFHFEIIPFLLKHCKTSANDSCIPFIPIFATFVYHFSLSIYKYAHSFF